MLTNDGMTTIKSRYDSGPELDCLDELLLLREAIRELSEPDLYFGSRCKILHELTIKGVQLHVDYNRANPK